MDTEKDSEVRQLLSLPMVMPRDFNLPHTEWRPTQFESIQYLSRVEEGRVVILQAPVGSGKTSLAKAMAKFGGTTGVVKTKHLQVQYSDGYNFDVVFGRGNYPCIHPERDNIEDTATECLYEGKMDECEYASECPYLIAKRKAMRSNCRVLNYSYMLTANWVTMKVNGEDWAKYSTPYLFLDECHNLPDETLEFVSCTVREGERIRWRLPEFPSVYESGKDGVDACLKWMSSAINALDDKIDELSEEKDTYSKAQKAKAMRLMNKIITTQAALRASGEDWYTRAGMRALEFNGNKIPGIVVKPLTAKYHFSKLFLEKYPRTVLMSATVGNPAEFCGELGIENYEFHQIPNQWPPESRPVHVADAPTMGQRATEPMKQKQAEMMAKTLNELPGDWSGIIHVTSWSQAWDLRKRLAKAGVKSGRLFIPDRGGTNKQIEQWNHERDRGVGMLVITPSMNAGVDLQKERICIIAKVPWGFTSPGTYDDERRRYSNKFYRWQTASDLEQRCGRTRRGKSEDYDDSFSIRGYVGIFDGSFQRMGLGKSCSLDFVDSLVFDK